MNDTRSQLTEAEMRRAWERRDAGYDGVFVFGVRTTGIFCRPSCPSRPKGEHLEFFPDAGAAIQAGYRPCKRCQPELAGGRPPAWVAGLLRHAVEGHSERLSARALRALGVAPERARRWFRAHYGMTFAAWYRGQRLARAWAQLRAGQHLDDVVFGHGFESHSGFRAAFARSFGEAPGRVGDRECLLVTLLETPLGPMLAAATGDALCQLEFADPPRLPAGYHQMRRHFGLPVVPGDNAVLERSRRELGEYFAGTRRDFSVPVTLSGTVFQQRVWQELRRIPYGQTISYTAVAQRLGSPAAVRAVARANGANRLYVLVPCHRVVAANGALSGYGGGVWRKRRLLELEQKGDQSRQAGGDAAPERGSGEEPHARQKKAHAATAGPTRRCSG